MKKYTPVLFFISVVFMIISHILISKGKAEIYPFYSWKLFSKPFGASEQDSIFTIYGLKNNDTLRITNSDSELYDANTKFSIINHYGSNIVQNIDTENSKISLKRLASISAPEFNRFILVKESFNPQLIGDRTFKTTKKIITTF